MVCSLIAATIRGQQQVTAEIKVYDRVMIKSCGRAGQAMQHCYKQSGGCLSCDRAEQAMQHCSRSDILQAALLAISKMLKNQFTMHGGNGEYPMCWTDDKR